MKNLIAYFEGAAHELNNLVNGLPTTGQNIRRMSAVLQANARMVEVKHLALEEELEPTNTYPEDAPEKEAEETLENDAD